MARYLVCNDIADPRRRYRVDRILKGTGLRAQESVFECEIEPEALKSLLRRLEKRIGKGSDRINLYRLCPKDEARIEAFGGVGILARGEYRIL